MDAVHAIRGQVLRAGWREIAEGTQTGRADALLWDPARGPLARWTRRSCSAAKSKNARGGCNTAVLAGLLAPPPKSVGWPGNAAPTLPVIVPRERPRSGGLLLRGASNRGFRRLLRLGLGRRACPRLRRAAIVQMTLGCRVLARRMWTRIWAKNVVNPAAAGTSSEQRSEYGYDHNAHHDTPS